MRLTLFFLLVSLKLSSQTVNVDFTVKPNACLQEDLKIQNISTNVTGFEWDFCQGDLQKLPVATNFLNLSSLGASVVVGTDFIKDNGNWYGFFCSLINGQLFRLDFGTDINNPAPQVVNLGNFNGNLKFPQAIRVVKDGGNFFAFVNDRENRLVRLNFGGSITAPAVDIITDILLTEDPVINSGLDVAFDGSNWYAFVTNKVNSKITIVQFGDHLSNAIIQTMETSDIASGIGDIELIKDGSNWYGLIVSISGSTIIRLDFGTALYSNPTSQDVTNGGLASFSPHSVWTAFENGIYQTFVSTSQGNLIRYTFGTAIDNPMPVTTDLGKLGVLTNTLKVSGIRDKSRYFIFSSDWSSNSIFKVSFPQTCDSNIEFFAGQDPELISYTIAGAKAITLYGLVDDEIVGAKTNIVDVQGAVSPEIQFNNTGVCVSNDVLFTPSSFDLVDYNWSFGDTQTSADLNPAHQYGATGNYNVSLQVTANNGCNNYAEKIISIYNEPITDFQMPIVTPFCSNQNYLFDNTSTIDVGYPATWQWKVNGIDVSSDEDLNFAFTSTTNQDISLTASIPGCDNEIVKSISSLQEGPIVDFLFEGQCEDENVTFTNNSSGSISSYSWDFDDGTNSTDTNPTHSFSSIGIYDVTLTAYTSSGCNNTTTKATTIYSKPQVNFHAKQPPFSCNGTPTVFEDDTPNPTDSNLSAWQWNFGDAGSGQNTSTLRNPQHVYDNAGLYDVSLTVYTNFLCSASLQLPVTISQTPVADFSYSAPCEDVSVHFTDGSPGIINSWEWQIGSTTYSTQNPTHIFANAGNTNATLSITTTSNACIGSISKPIVIPAKLTPNFSVSKNCVNQETLFTDITNDAADPINLHEWNIIGGASATGDPAVFTFSTPSVPSVKLMVTTQTGCEYSITKPVTIIPSPIARFTATPETGGPPLTVHFTNTSVNANSYHWSFNDPNNSTSNQASPMFTYEDLGQYQAELTVFNSQNCSHSSSTTINVIESVINVAVNGLELTEFQNGSLRPSVTIFNNGNIPISNLPLLLDLSGSVIREHVNATIQANSSYRHVFQFELTSTNALEYFCVEAEIEDITLQDNRACLTLQESLTIFTPHPNPSSNGVLNLNWVLEEDGIVSLKLVNSMGQIVKDFQVDSVEGLNQFALNTNGIGSGVYFVKFNFKQITKVYRVIISE